MRSVPTERPRRLGDGGVARHGLSAPDRHRQTARVVHEPVAVAALVAEPPLVNVGVEARLEPGDPLAAGVMRAPTIDVDLDVAPARATRADGLGGVEVPDADLEAEVAVSERAHRADVHDVPGVLVLEVAAGKEPDLRVIAAVEDAELAGARSEEHTSELQS